jgi:hypothetical protein
MDQKPLKVFISYKWEEDAHNRWVEKFATDLRTAGFDAILDRWEVRFGDSFTDYMTSKIHEADVILFIMTTRSVAAAEAPKGEGGAVKFEIQMATSRRIAGENMRLIGIYREGHNTVAHLRDHRYADFRDDSKYEENLKELIDDLLGKDKRPPLPLRIDSDYQPQPTPIPVPFLASGLDKREMSVLGALYDYSLKNDTDFIDLSRFIQSPQGKDTFNSHGDGVYDTIEYLADSGYFDNVRKMANNLMIFHGNGYGFEVCASLLGFATFDKLLQSAIRKVVEYGTRMTGDQLAKALTAFGELRPIVILYLFKVMKNRGWINYIHPMGTNAQPVITAITSLGKRAAQ